MTNKTFKAILGLILAWALVAQAGIAIAQSPTITSMHTAATATGNGTALIVSGAAGNPANAIGAAGIQIANSAGTFTITFETLTSGSTWTAVMATNMTDDVRATTATAAGQYTVLLGGAVQLRARISACSGCNVTVVGRLVPGLVARVASGSGGGGGSGTVTSVGWTGGIVSVATATTTPAFTIAGTSGGIPYFDSTSTWASSAALAANALVIGGGAGAAPSTTTTGTGVLTALGVNTGSAGAFVVNGGALGTPSSGTLTSATGLPISTGLTGASYADYLADVASDPTIIANYGNATYFADGVHFTSAGYALIATYARQAISLLYP